MCKPTVLNNEVWFANRSEKINKIDYESFHSAILDSIRNQRNISQHSVNSMILSLVLLCIRQIRSSCKYKHFNRKTTNYKGDSRNNEG